MTREGHRASDATISHEEMPVNLVELDTVRIDQEIEREFSKPDCGDSRTLYEVGQLLETPALPMAVAIKELGFIEAETQLIYCEGYAEGGHLALTKAQVITLNHHPYVRTVDLHELIMILDASGTVIREVAASEGIEAAVPKNAFATTYYRTNRERFNKDQIVALRDALTVYFTPPEDFISQGKLLEVTGISNEALSDISRRLGVQAVWAKPDSTTEQVEFLSPQDALKVLRYIKDPQFRRVIQAELANREGLG